MRDIYAITPGVPLLHRPDSLMWELLGKDTWYQQGMPRDIPMTELFGWDADTGMYTIYELGGYEPPLLPAWEEKVLEDRGDHELVLDRVGRHVLFFKGPRWGYMPTYISHPVRDQQSWEENVKWRLDPANPERYGDLEQRMVPVKEAAAQGQTVDEMVSGGYMYLRGLIGPVDLPCMFYDQPDLIHQCMETWLELLDAVIASHQRYITVDQLSFDEDICYKNGPLISPAMIREFLLPYYQQLVANIQSRQLDPSRHLHVFVHTDGHAPSVIPLYQEIGLDSMHPFEVAAGCDVVEVGRQFPDLVICGGIDKRILAKSKEAIDEHLRSIVPAMRARGGYLPNCDHCVPEEVSYDNYLHYRKRCLELGA